jgi:hypothetical protein
VGFGCATHEHFRNGRGGGVRRGGRRSRVAGVGPPWSKRRPKEEECLQRQGSQVYAALLQATHLLLPLQGLYLVSCILCVKFRSIHYFSIVLRKLTINLTISDKRDALIVFLSHFVLFTFLFVFLTNVFRVCRIYVYLRIRAKSIRYEIILTIEKRIGLQAN